MRTSRLGGLCATAASCIHGAFTLSDGDITVELAVCLFEDIDEELSDGSESDSVDEASASATAGGTDVTIAAYCYSTAHEVASAIIDGEEAVSES